MRGKNESGGVVTYLVATILAAALLFGGIYLLKNSSSQSTDEIPVAVESEIEVVSDDAAFEQESSSETTARSSTASETTRSSSQTQTQTQSQSPTVVADAGPTRIAATGVAPEQIPATGAGDFFGIILAAVAITTTGYMTVMYRQSRRAVARATVKSLSNN